MMKWGKLTFGLWCNLGTRPSHYWLADHTIFINSVLLNNLKLIILFTTRLFLIVLNHDLVCLAQPWSGSRPISATVSRQLKLGQPSLICISCCLEYHKAPSLVLCGSPYAPLLWVRLLECILTSNTTFMQTTRSCLFISLTKMQPWLLTNWILVFWMFKNGCHQVCSN